MGTSQIKDAVRFAKAMQIYVQKDLQKLATNTNNVNELLTKAGLRHGSFDSRFPVMFSFHGIDIIESLNTAVASNEITSNAASIAKQAMYNAMVKLSNTYPVLEKSKWEEIEAALESFSNTIVEGASNLDNTTDSKHITALTSAIVTDMRAKYNILRSTFDKAYLVSYNERAEGLEPSVKIIHNSFSNFRDSINRVIKAEISKLLKENHITNSKLHDPTYLTTKILNWGHTRTQENIISGKLIASLISLKSASASTEVMNIITKDFIRETGQMHTNIRLHKGDLTKGNKEVLSLVINSSYLQKVAVQNRIYNQVTLAQQEIKWNIVEAVQRNPELKRALGISSISELMDMLINMKSSPSVLDNIHNVIVSKIMGSKIKGQSSTTKILDSKIPIKQKQKTVSIITRPGTGSKPRARTASIIKESVVPLVNLEAILRARINEQVRQNMGSGSETRILNYRTGRFSESVSIERLSESRQGMITVFYNYMKNPYATFSEGGRQQYPKTRDPKLLISKSIREIAAPYVSNRLRSVVV